MARGPGREAPSSGRGGRPGRAAWLRSPDLVAVLAILVPGLGHLALGRPRAGLGWLAATLVGYWAVFFPGAILHACSVLAAYRGAGRRAAATLTG